MAVVGTGTGVKNTEINTRPSWYFASVTTPLVAKVYLLTEIVTAQQ